MPQPATSDKYQNAFGDAIVKKDWQPLHQLLSAEHFPTTTAPDLEPIFGWERLEPLLRIDWSIQTGEPNDPSNPLAPPIRHRHYPVSQIAAARCELLDGERRPVFPVIDATRFDEWREIQFEPADDSGFDVSYYCEVALVDVRGAKLVGAFIVSNVLD